jgi:hypothetical protein
LTCWADDFSSADTLAFADNFAFGFGLSFLASAPEILFHPHLHCHLILHLIPPLPKQLLIDSADVIDARR